MFEKRKFCPVCGELVAVYQGDPDKYGDRAEWNWHRFIRLKYDCQECRDMMNAQSKRNSGKRCRAQWREQRRTLLDVVDAYRQETILSRERAATLEKENRLSRQRIAELEARRS